MERPDSAEFSQVRGVVAARMRELRLARGLSQEELADKAGFHRTYIGMLERRQGNPSLQALALISEALGVGMSELLSP